MKRGIKHISTVSLILTNLFIIFNAFFETINLYAIMWVYWSQSVIIGAFNFLRILQLKEFTTKGFRINGRPAKPTKGTKSFTAFFFLIHYGLFHIVYAFFLFSGPIFTALRTTPALGSVFNPMEALKTLLFIVGGALLFFINHLISFRVNKKPFGEKPNIGKVMFYPYPRIIPMHLTIILGGFLYAGKEVVILFLILKMLADVIMHVMEHKKEWESNQRKTPPLSNVVRAGII